MKKIIIPLIFILLTGNLHTSPLHFKLKHSVIIDTDCGVSDLRTISLLLSLSTVKIKAVVISGNSPDRKTGFEILESLLNSFSADSVIIKNEELPGVEVNAKKTGRKQQVSYDALKIYRKVLGESNEKITVICLGSLTNPSELLKLEPSLVSNIGEVIWYNDNAVPLQGFNYNSDRAAAENLLKSGLNIDIISNLQYKNACFDTTVVNIADKAVTKAARIFGGTFKKVAGENNTSTDNLIVSEELVAISIANHELFEMTPAGEKSKIRFNNSYSITSVNEIITDILTGTYIPGHFVAFNGFPMDRSLYTYDVRLMMDEAIDRYGIDEWKACVMTDEFHGHLGVYSIVGAKMGILAREYFGVSTDILKIESYAGSTPPFSCMNDGLQVSTGATLGQGTIHLANDPVTKPQALFCYNNNKILIKLRPEYIFKLQDVINMGIKNYGLEDEDYWILVRQSAIRFWLEWDRKKMFDLTEIN
jgi:pyrimidine-specific ribonucleoside hydrolase